MSSSLASELKHGKGGITSLTRTAPPVLWSDLYSPVAGPASFEKRLKRARASELKLRDYKYMHYMLTLLCEEQQAKLEKSMQSLLEVSYPAGEDLLLDCKLSELGEWQRSHTAAHANQLPIGEVIGVDKQHGTVTFRIFAERSNADIDARRAASGELTLPVRWCKFRLGRL